MDGLGGGKPTERRPQTRVKSERKLSGVYTAQQPFTTWPKPNEEEYSMQICYTVPTIVKGDLTMVESPVTCVHPAKSDGPM